MSKQFRFKNESLKLNIEGKEYTLKDIFDINTSKMIKELGEKLKDFNFDEETSQSQLNSIVKEVLNTLFEEDAYKGIFENRDVKMIEAIQLFNFLEEEITEYRLNAVENKYV